MEKISVKKPFTVLVAVVVVLALGIVSVTQMTTDLLPEMSFPYLMIITPYPGASPERVESEVSIPLEEALGTIKNVQNVFSTSAENYSMVQLEFVSGANMDSAMVNVSSAVNQAKAGMPAGCGTPSILELGMDLFATMYVAVGREGADIYELSDYVNRTVIPAFQRLGGVANVTDVGVVEKSVQLDLNRAKIDALNDRILEQTNLTLADARTALDEARRQVEQGQAALEAQQAQFGSTLASALFDQLDDQAGGLSGQLQAGVTQLMNTLGRIQTGLGELRTQQSGGVVGNGTVLTPQTALPDGGNPNAGGVVDSMGNFVEVPADTGMASDAAPPESAAAAQDAETGQEETDQTMPDGGVEEDSEICALREAAEQAAESLRAALRERLARLISRLQGAWERFGGGTLREVIAAAAELNTIIGEIRVVLSAVAEADTAGILSGWIASARQGLDGLSDQTASVPELLDTLEVAYAGLTQGQLEAAVGFAAASQQLAQAKSQLESADAQYEQARREALSAANIDALVDASTLSQLIYAQNFAMPAGYIDDAEDNSWLLRVGDEYGSETDIAEALLSDIPGIGTVRISDIADLTVIDNAGLNYANLNGEEGIMLCIFKSSTAGTNAVSRNCDRAIRELKAEDPALSVVKLVDQGKYITLIVNSIVESMVLGAILAIVILALFLKDVRPTLIVGISIPLSVLFALVLMYFTDLSLNMMTLSGLALGIGMLVDNSIVVMENVVRLRSSGLPAPRAAVQGTKQVAGSIIASTLTTISVFVPMAFTTGTVREMLVPLALSVSYCLVASLLVAVTVIPASASTILSRVQPKTNRLMERLQARYGKLLYWCLRHKAIPLLVSIGLLALSVFRVLTMGIVILPELTSDTVDVTILTDPGDDRGTSYAKADQVMEAILSVDGIEDVGIMDYGSVVSSVGALASVQGGSYGNYICYVTIPEGTGSKAIQSICEEIQEKTADLDCEVSVSTGSMADFVSFTASGLSIDIYGNDPKTLARLAAEVAAEVERIEGFIEVNDGSQDAAATLHLVIDKDKAMGYGLTVAQIYAQIAQRLATDVTGTTVTIDSVEMDVTVSNNTDPVTRENLLDMEFTAVSISDMSSMSGMSMGGMSMGDMGMGGMSMGSMGDFGDMGGMESLMEAFGVSSADGDGTSAPEQQEDTAADTGETEDAADGGVHKLREFAYLEETSSAASISRENLSRYVTVTAGTAEGYNTTVLTRQLQSGLDQMIRDLPSGYSIEVGGESEQVNDMVVQMLELAGLGLLFIYLVMVAQFQSLLSPFIILFTVPLAFTGGMLGLIVAGEQLSMLSMMGFLILMGTVVNNGIVFVDYTNQLRLGGLEKHDALVATGRTRMRPILMTTLTTILAMAQLIFGDDMGSQMGGGMAIVITGGLLYATLMTLFIVPVMYDILFRKTPKVIDVGDDINDAPDDAAEFLAALRAERE